MALQAGVCRSCSGILHRLLNANDGSLILMFAGGITKLPVATLRATFGEKYPYEKPFPYEEWPLHSLAFSQDYTEWRFNENTKVFPYQLPACLRKVPVYSLLSLVFLDFLRCRGD